MTLINKEITDYLKENRVVTIATSKNNIPWCAICYYIYDEEKNLIIFKSSTSTRHIQEMLLQSRIAGTVYKPAKTPAHITGLQFTAKAVSPDSKTIEALKRLYLQRFPLANLIEAKLYAVRPDFFKMTNNKLGMGKKIIWKKEEEKIYDSV